MNVSTHNLRHSWVTRNIILILVLAAFVSVIATYITLTGDREALGIKPQRLWLLLMVNLLLLTMLIGMIAARIFGMWSKLRVETAGSKLQKRILLLFSIVTIVPTVIVSVFSALFFNLGIQTWFNERVQTAVEESLVVAQAYLNEHRDNIRADAIAMAADLNRAARLALTDPVEFNRIVVAQSTLRELTETIVFQRNRIIAQGRLSFALAFEHVPQDMLERAARGEVIATTSDDKVRALIRLEALPDTYMIVGRLIDSKVLTHMDSTQGAVNEYNNLKSQLNRLQLVFSIVFITLALLLLLSSTSYGMVFASRLTNPISRLVAAAERVRSGDFSARVEDAMGNDEIGTLARTFNRMTEQLEAQRADLIEANRRLDERRRFSEAVLSGVSAGVIAIDRDKNITLANRSSAAILQTIGRTVKDGAAIADILPGIQELLSQAEALPGEVARGTLSINEGNKTLTLHVRVTVEKAGEQLEGFIVTFDDITLLVAAQRNAAWADVARRVAHEIKNPLTPIQLSTERLKRKYLKFITEDQENFTKYIDTIAKHAGDIAKMVEEFVAFARLPTPVFADEELSGIIRKAVFSAQVANPNIEYALDLPESPVMLHCDERQIGQVMTNLLKNAAEAVESKLSTLSHRDRGGVSQGEGPHPARGASHPLPEGEGKGQIAVGLTCKGDTVTVTVEDNGIGFPPESIQTMLEPYVTTRTKGMGLGLSIVKKIVEDHKGSIRLENASGGGARVILSFHIVQG